MTRRRDYFGPIGSPPIQECSDLNDDRVHAAFDRYLQPSKVSTLSSATKRRIHVSIRTVYTTTICTVLGYLYNWGGILQYLSYMVSAISSAIYLGDLMKSFRQVCYGTVIGTGLGTIIGLTHRIPSVQLILLFIVLTLANKCSAWDRAGKVFAGLCIVLGAFMPNTLTTPVSSFQTFYDILAIVLVPYTITFFSLLFPIPSLSSEVAKFKSGVVCRELSAVSVGLVRGFIAQEFQDLYNADFDHLYRGAEEELESLIGILQSAEYEAMIIPSLEQPVHRLKEFRLLASKLLLELIGLRDMLLNIKNNTTQAKFVESMAVHLEDVSAELSIALRLLYEEITAFSTPESIVKDFARKAIDLLLCRDADKTRRRRSYSSTLHCSLLWEDSATLISRRLAEIQRRRLFLLEEERSLDDNSMEASFELASYFDTTKPIMNDLTAPNDVDMEDVFQNMDNGGNRTDEPISVPEEEDPKSADIENQANRTTNLSNFSTKARSSTMAISSQPRLDNFNEAIIRLNDAKQNVIDSFMLVRREYLWKKPEGFVRLDSFEQLNVLTADDDSKSQESRHGHGSNISDTTHRSSLRDISHSKAKMTIDEFKVLVNENHTMRNLNPRGAYIHRLLEICNSVNSFGKLFTVKPSHPWPESLYLSLSDCCMYFFKYFYDSFMEFFESCMAIAQRIAAVCGYYSGHFLTGQRNENPNPSFDTESSKPHRPVLITSDDYSYITSYIQPLKIALAITVTSLLIVIPTIRDKNQNGLWAVVVITLIRQDSTSSSFLIGYQRVEGTVMGAVYAFTAYQAFNCGNVSCGEDITLPVLLLWLGFCSFFREGPRHGYASLVAAITPFVIFLGPYVGTTELAWLRIQRTFIGVAAYLVIDNLIWPNRTDQAIRTGVVQAVDQTTEIFSNLILAVKQLTDIGASMSPNSSPKWPSKHDKHSLFSMVHNRSPSMAHVDDEVRKLNVDEFFRRKFDKFHDLPIDSPSPVIVPTKETSPKNEDQFRQSEEYLSQANQIISSLQALISKQSANLKDVIHDPEIWHRPFPLSTYTNLIACFNRLLRSARSVHSGAEGFKRILKEMTIREEDVTPQLRFYDFMTKRIFAVASRTSTALKMTSTALHRLYEKNDLRTDLSPLITLMKYFDRVLKEVDNHFKHLFITSEVAPTNISPCFLLAWQNMFESLCDWIKSLSHLGMSLHAVRSVEGLSAT